MINKNRKNIIILSRIKQILIGDLDSSKWSSEWVFLLIRRLRRRKNISY